MPKKIEVKLVCEIDGVQYNMVTCDYSDKLKEMSMVDDSQDEILEFVWGEYHDGNLF